MENYYKTLLHFVNKAKLKFYFFITNRFIIFVVFGGNYKTIGSEIMIQNEAKILQVLNDYGYDIFTKKQLRKISLLSDKQLEISLRNLIKNGQIIIIENGKYCIYGFADEFVIGSFLSNAGGIAYWSAMNYHGLTEQIPNVIFVQTIRQKQSKKILNVPYRFVWLKPSKSFGFKTEGYGNHSYRITDLEKTILDCFDLPKYSGGYPEIIKAFYNAKLNSRKLITYSKKMNNISVSKRLAYLAELFEKKELDGFMKYVKTIIKQKYNLFEHNGESTGKINKKWRLIINLSEEEIVNMATI